MFSTPLFATRQVVTHNGRPCTVEKALYKFDDGHVEPVYGGACHDNVRAMSCSAEKPARIAYQVLSIQNNTVVKTIVNEENLSRQ